MKKFAVCICVLGLGMMPTASHGMMSSIATIISLGVFHTLSSVVSDKLSHGAQCADDVIACVVGKPVKLGNVVYVPPSHVGIRSGCEGMLCTPIPNQKQQAYQLCNLFGNVVQEFSTAGPTNFKRSYPTGHLLSYDIPVETDFTIQPSTLVINTNDAHHALPANTTDQIMLQMQYALSRSMMPNYGASKHETYQKKD